VTGAYYYISERAKKIFKRQKSKSDDNVIRDDLSSLPLTSLTRGLHSALAFTIDMNSATWL
jgi:hypothetical protein